MPWFPSCVASAVVFTDYRRDYFMLLYRPGWSWHVAWHLKKFFLMNCYKKRHLISNNSDGLAQDSSNSSYCCLAVSYWHGIEYSWVGGVLLAHRSYFGFTHKKNKKKHSSPSQASSRVSCQKGPTRHAYAWRVGPFWRDTLELWDVCCGYLGTNWPYNYWIALYVIRAICYGC